MSETKITLKNEYGEYSVSANRSDLAIDEAFEILIIPVLLASGYSKELIDEYLAQ